MIPRAFEYQRPASVKEALALLAKHGEDAKLLAGGHSLIPIMKLRFAAPKVLVDIGRIGALRGIRREGGRLVIGALTPHAEVAASAEVRKSHRALAEAAAAIGDVQVRNRGTLGGSLAHADPAADYPAAVLALGGEIVAQGAKGSRTIPAEDFFRGTFATALKPDEIITEVRFPDAGGAGSAYEKFAQAASGFAIAGACAVVRLKGGKCEEARVAVTGVSDRPVRLKSVEKALAGKGLDDASVNAASAQADADLKNVREDLSASAEYRRHLAKVVAGHALLRAAR